VLANGAHGHVAQDIVLVEDARDVRLDVLHLVLDDRGERDLHVVLGGEVLRRQAHRRHARGDLEGHVGEGNLPVEARLGAAVVLPEAEHASLLEHVHDEERLEVRPAPVNPVQYPIEHRSFAPGQCRTSRLATAG
jgi:hypothetical protein